MRSRDRFLGLALVVGLVLLPVSLWAAGRTVNVDRSAVMPGYVVDESVPAVYRGTIAGAEAFSDVEGAAALAIEDVFCGGYTSVTVSGHFSAPGATQVVTIVRYNLDGTQVRGGSSTGTLTAGTVATDSAGLFLSTQGLGFDTRGAPRCRVFFFAAPSAGTIDPYVEVH